MLYLLQVPLLRVFPVVFCCILQTNISPTKCTTYCIPYFIPCFTIWTKYVPTAKFWSSIYFSRNCTVEYFGNMERDFSVQHNVLT